MNEIAGAPLASGGLPPMSIRFDGQNAIITGAGNGLGRSYALYLASLGANVIVNDVGVAIDGRGGSQEPARAVVDEITSNGGKAVASFDDVSTSEGARNLIQEANRHFGPVDIIICSAGVLRDRGLSRMPPEDFEFVVRVHLLGSAHVIKAALPQMMQKNYGRIVLTTSTSGLYGCHGQTNYGSAKLAVVGLMKSLARETLSANVRINSIAPLALTRQTKLIFSNGASSFFGTHTVAAMVAYLCSQSCATSGDIIVAGAGHYAKAEVLQSPGCRFDVDAITPEQIAESYCKITDMQGAVPFSSGKDAVTAIARQFQNHQD